MAVIEMELTDLWGRVIDVVAADAPQHRAFLSLTKPLGLLQSDGTTNLLVAAPNAFAKDVLESRLRTVVNEVLTAELGEKAGRVFTLENLNTAVDHPGTPFAKAAETIELVKRVNSPFVRLNLDLYHAQIGEGNLVELVREAFNYIGEIQIADVPGRAEPGSGEVFYPRVAKELKALDYQGVVALESFASGESSKALEAFKSAFTV